MTVTAQTRLEYLTYPNRAVSALTESTMRTASLAREHRRWLCCSTSAEIRMAGGCPSRPAASAAPVAVGTYCYSSGSYDYPIATGLGIGWFARNRSSGS
jgi:hypothetical protein